MTATGGLPVSNLLPTATSTGAAPTVTRPLRIALVNDYEVVVAGIASLLESYADRVEVVELDLNSEPTQPVDIAVYDTFAATATAADLRGLFATDQVTHLVAYSFIDDEQAVGDYIAAGADGSRSGGLAGALTPQPAGTSSRACRASTSGASSVRRSARAWATPPRCGSARPWQRRRSSSARDADRLPGAAEGVLPLRQVTLRHELWPTTRRWPATARWCGGEGLSRSSAPSSRCGRCASRRGRGRGRP